jgi:hypothetical protein
MLGFKVIDDDPEKEYVILEMGNDSSGFITKKLKAAISLLAGDEPIKFVFEKHDLQSGIHDIIMKGIDPSLIKKQESDEGTKVYYF